MATSLAIQLANIAQSSIRQLDLKAQKQRHAVSLLFDAREAARQSFEEIFTFVQPAYADLCALDVRFHAFSNTLFHFDSHRQERGTFTQSENEDISKLSRAFLQLIQGRLQLRPAQRCVEWLIRRWKVHERGNEIEELLLAFLPFHATDLFSGILGVVGANKLPSDWKWLVPYANALDTVPSQVVVAATTRQLGCFRAFQDWTMESARRGYAGPALLGFWASTTCQGVATMLDNSQSSRAEVRRQRVDDVLTLTLPMLQEAFRISRKRDIAELFFGSCTLTAILATKADLDDRVIDALIDTVATSRPKVDSNETIVVLILLIEERSCPWLSKSAYKFLTGMNDWLVQVQSISAHHRIEKLITAAVTAAFEDRNPKVFESVFSSGILSNISGATMIAHLVERFKGDDSPSSTFRTCLQSLPRVDDYANLIQPATGSGITDGQTSAPSGELTLPANADADQHGAMEVSESTNIVNNEADSALASLPRLPEDLLSFLAPSHSQVFHPYAQAFGLCADATQTRAKLFRVLGILGGSDTNSHVRGLTFLMRVSAHAPLSPSCRQSALDCASDELLAKEAGGKTDLQAVLPYLIAALTDSDKGIRSSASKVTRRISELYGSADDKGRLRSSKLVQSCRDSFYGSESHHVMWLTAQDAYSFVQNVILPVLEDCILDSQFFPRYLKDALNGIHSSGQGEKGLKVKTRESICDCLISHATMTPSFRTKITILNILAGVGKASSHARTVILLPYCRAYFSSSNHPLDLYNDHNEIFVVAGALIRMLSHRSKEELELLKDIASCTIGLDLGQSTHAFTQLKQLFSHMKLPSQLALLEFLWTTYTDGQSDYVRADSLETLRDIPLSAELLTHLLNVLAPMGNLLGSEPPSKRRRTSGSTDDRKAAIVTGGAELSREIQRITIVLELVDGSRPEEKSKLITNLFKLLVELEQLKRRTRSEMVYLQQLLLSLLRSAVDASQPTTQIDRNAVRTDVVVELVRSTNSPQVHAAALELMTTLAKWDPEIVLHSVMPLFTFMSTTLLQRSDEYTAALADLAIESIIPALAASLKKGSGRTPTTDILKGSSELLLSFVAAWEHVPLHRRLPLVRRLVETLGQDHVLGAMVVSLMERYSKHSQIRNFVIELLDDFELSVQINALQQYLDLVEDSLRPKRSLSSVILGMNDRTVEEVNETVAALLGRLADLIDHHSELRGMMIKQLTRTDTEAATLKLQYASIMEQAMRINFEGNSSSVVQAAARRLVLAFIDLLPTPQLLEAGWLLMDHGGEDVHQSLLRSIEKRTHTVKQGQNGSLATTFTGPGLDFCLSFLADSAVGSGTRHVAISTADTIVERFGKTDRAAARRVAEVVSGTNGLQSEDTSLQVISLLTLTTLIEILGEDVVPLFQHITSLVLGKVERNLEDANQTDSAVNSAGFAFFSAVLDHIPYMMSQDILQTTLRLSALLAGLGEIQVAESYGALCAHKVLPEVLFTALKLLLQSARGSAMKIEGLSLWLQVFKQAVERQRKRTIAANAPGLFQALMAAFELREATGEESEDDENSNFNRLVNEVAMAVVLKVNDSTFRPFFNRFVDFATSGTFTEDNLKQPLRLQALYSFSLTLSEQLKGIVTSYASFLLPSAVQALSTLPSTKHSEQDIRLLGLVLETLESSFRGDQDDFWSSPAHFGTVMEPLLSVTARAKSLSDQAIQMRLIPAVVELAAAVSSSQDHLKAINGHLLTLARSEAAKVRMVAVQTQRAVSARLEEDWLVLLPEMLPAISELMEDDDEDVESATVAWVRDIEEITGESLDGMLA